MSTTEAAPKTSARVHVQRFGTFLSNMVMPNIGAFIAWGFITAIFIKDGWINLAMGGTLPNDSWVAQIGGWGVDAASCAQESLVASGDTVNLPAGLETCAAYGGMVGPMITYLLPLLIAYTGGKVVYDVRGGVVGAIATMGVISGTSIPMFMGAMIMGPLGGWTMKKLDALWDGKIRPGFEMLVNNFSAGIWGMFLAVFGFFVMGPIVSGISTFLGGIVGWLVDFHLLPITSVLIEPAKILFLNNAINHGILTPLGLAEAAESGKSILFLLEANPGPGLGLLLAFSVFGRGAAKGSAPGAAIIHFFGGIHEIYFPYVLMKPALIAAMIGGGATGVAVNQLFGTGLRAPAAPGSIIAIYAQTATDSYLGVTLAVLAAAAVTFLIAMVILKAGKGGADDLAAATASMEEMKGKKSSVSGQLTGASASDAKGPIKNIVFACDAGMGSSAMGASVLRKKIHGAGFTDVTVVNKAIANLTDTFDLVVTHQDLTPRAKQGTPSAIHVSVDNFMASPRYDEVVDLLKRVNNGEEPSDPEPSDPAPADPAPGAGPASIAQSEPVEQVPADESNAVLQLSSIVLDGTATDRDEAITETGNLLVATGNVDAGYVESMHERERSVSTYMGNLLAIPHGTNEAKSMIARSSISVVRYPNGIEWNGNPVKFAIGIAGAGNDHLELLGKIAEVFLDDAKIAQLESATSAEQIRDVFGGVSVAAPAAAAAVEEPAPAEPEAVTEPVTTEDVNAVPAAGTDETLALSSIVLDGTATDKLSAITEAGNLLVATGNVAPAYVESMHERERSVSTYMGNLLAIPHGTNDAKAMIARSSISVVRYPNGIEWNGNPVKFVIGIAGAGNDHLALLGKIAEVFLDESRIAELEAATTAAQIRDAFGKVNG